MSSRRAPEPPALPTDPRPEAVALSRTAVKRCYDGLCRSGQPERYALEAAVTVYRWHHPETPLSQAENIVALWVGNAVLH